MTEKGRSVEELTDEELEAQGTHAHQTRNWVFLHGTAEQFANHTVRMLALEQEYLRRHPKRTWQGSGGAATEPVEAIELLQQALVGVIAQLQALAVRKFTGPERAAVAHDDPVGCLLAKLAEQPSGRMHKLELHQAARECGLSREALAALYHNESQLLAAERGDRVLTAKGREYLAHSGDGRHSRNDGT
ncbi:MAG TPA: DUF6158 family protein [Mycobacterium sp.]|nr:DUF6158 family protein [Mycobacterium sp.]